MAAWAEAVKTKAAAGTAKAAQVEVAKEALEASEAALRAAGPPLAAAKRVAAATLEMPRVNEAVVQAAKEAGRTHRERLRRGQ